MLRILSKTSGNPALLKMKYKYNFISAATSLQVSVRNRRNPCPRRFYFPPFKSPRLLQDRFFDVAAELE